MTGNSAARGPFPVMVKQAHDIWEKLLLNSSAWLGWLLLDKIYTGVCSSNVSFYPWQVLLATLLFAWLFSLGTKINGSEQERKEGRKENTEQRK